MSTQKKQSSSSLVNLTPEARRRLAKPHSRFEVYAGPLLALYEAHVGQMRIAGVELASVRAALASYESLAANEAEAEQQLELVSGTRLYHASTVWRVMLEIYARAQAFARTDASIREAVGDFEAFMKHGKRGKKAKTPTTPAPTSSAA